MGASQTSTTQQQQTNVANPVAQAALTPFGQIGLNVAQTPYSQNMSPQVAAQNQQQLSAIQGLGGLQSNNPASPFINQANQYSQLAADPNNVNAMTSQFLNPMTSEVMGQMQNVFGQQNAQLLGNEAASGAIGGSRAGIAAGNLANQQGLAAGQTEAGLYQQALNAAQTQQGQISQQAFTQGQLGNEALNTGLTGINAALQGGNLTQAQQQAILNAAQQGAIQQTLFPQQEAAAGENIALGTTALGGTTTGQGTTTQPVNYLGQVLGGLTAGAGLIASDEHVKENIEPIGKSFDKQTIYKFNYIGDPTARIGLMAQEVQKKHPGAVKEINGTKAVDYNKATAKSAEMGEHRLHRDSGGVVVPQTNYPTLNLNPPSSQQSQQSGSGMPPVGALGQLGGSTGTGDTLSGAASGIGDALSGAGTAIASGIGDAAGAIGSGIGDLFASGAAADFLPALAFLADGGSVRKHRAIGGGTGVGLGDSGVAALGGLPNSGGLLSYNGIQSPLQPYFAKSPQVVVPQSNSPTLNLNPGQNTAQQQQNQQAQQFSQLGTALGKSGIGSNIADAFATPDFGGGSDFARGGRIHRDDGGPVQLGSLNQDWNWQPSAAPQPVEQDVTAQPSPMQGFLDRRAYRVPPSLGATSLPDPNATPETIASVNPAQAPTMGAQSATPGSGQYIEMGYDGRPIGAPQKPIQDRLTQPPVQQAAIASPAQTPPPSIPDADMSKPDWGDIPHTPQLMNDRQQFAEELRQNPALRQKYLTISLQEQNDPTGNLAIFESAMNRASVNHTTLAQELKMHATEGGYYGGPYRPELLNNPHYKQMAELNLERALNGSNVAKYGTDNSSGDFGRIRNSNGMYTPTAAYNGEYISYPSRSDARGYNGFPEWLNNVGGSIEGGLNQFAGSVKNAGQQFGSDVSALPGSIGQGISSAFGGNKPSVLNDPSLQPPKPGESELDKRMAEFGFKPNQPQGLGGSLGRALGQQPLMSDQNSNRLVNMGIGMMAAGPSVGVKGFPGAAISALTSAGKGGQFALNQEQQERNQAINMANAATSQKAHDLQAQHYAYEMKKPFKIGTEIVTDSYGRPYPRDRMGVPDPNSPTGYREIPSPQAGQTNATPSNPPESLEELQKTVPANVWNESSAIADYDRAPYNARNSQPGSPGALVMQTAREIARLRGEEYDEGTYGAKKQAIKVLTSGIDSRALANGNVGIGHFYDIVQSVDKMDPGQYPSLNQARNWLSTQAGKDATKSYNSNAGLLAEELVSFYRGIGGAEADIQRELKNLDPNLSLEQQRGVIGKMATMIRDKLNALETKRNFAFGKNAEKKLPLLNNQAKEELGAIEKWANRGSDDRGHIREVQKGGSSHPVQNVPQQTTTTPAKPESAVAAPATPARPANVPEGAGYSAKTGKWYDPVTHQPIQ